MFSWFHPGTRLAGRFTQAAFAVAAVLCMGFGGTAAQAQTRTVAQANGNAKAVVVAPLTLLKTQDMDFGKIAPRPTAGTVTIDPATQTCAVTGPILRFGTCAAAQFVGQGSKNLGARVSIASATNLTGPGTTMVLDNIVLGGNSSIVFIGNTNAQGSGVGLSAGGGNQRYSIVSSSGIFTLSIGATLHVNANQAPGVYHGSITVSVQYL